MVTEKFSPGAEAAEVCADHSLIFSAEIKNANLHLQSPTRLQGVTLNKAQQNL